MKTLKSLSLKPKREAYVRAHAQHGLAHQIRMLREHRGWTQADLARKIGARNQSTVARLEDPSYGKYSVSSLLKLASAFDVAALVKFVSFSELLEETADVSPLALTALSFGEEGEARNATIRSVNLHPYDQFITIALNEEAPTYVRQPIVTVYAEKDKDSRVALG